MRVVKIVMALVLGAAALFSCSSAPVAEQVETAVEPIAQVVEAPVQKETQVIHLNQVPGAFTNGDLTLKAGTYSFEVANSGVAHEVGLVVAPKKSEITAEDHLPNAYVSEVVKNGETKASKGEVVLTKGEYVYFCPLNPTEQYSITVE